jgi:hypothetical protein
MQTLADPINEIGIRKLASRCGLSPGAIIKWRDADRLPQSELAGLTNYATLIAELSQSTDYPVTADQLLAHTRSKWEKRF